MCAVSCAKLKGAPKPPAGAAVCHVAPFNRPCLWRPVRVPHHPLDAPPLTAKRRWQADMRGHWWYTLSLAYIYIEMGDRLIDGYLCGPTTHLLHGDAVLLADKVVVVRAIHARRGYGARQDLRPAALLRLDRQRGRAGLVCSSCCCSCRILCLQLVPAAGRAAGGGARVCMEDSEAGEGGELRRRWARHVRLAMQPGRGCLSPVAMDR